MELKNATMLGEEGDEMSGEQELAAPDWRVRARPHEQIDTKGEREARSKHTCRSETGAHTV